MLCIFLFQLHDSVVLRSVEGLHPVMRTLHQKPNTILHSLVTSSALEFN